MRKCPCSLSQHSHQSDPVITPVPPVLSQPQNPPEAPISLRVKAKVPTVTFRLCVAHPLLCPHLFHPLPSIQPQCPSQYLGQTGTFWPRDLCTCCVLLLGSGPQALSGLLPDLLASFLRTLCRPRCERPALHLPSYLLCALGVPHRPHGLFASVYLPFLTSMDTPGWQGFLSVLVTVVSQYPEQCSVDKYLLDNFSSDILERDWGEKGKWVNRGGKSLDQSSCGRQPRDLWDSGRGQKGLVTWGSVLPAVHL